MLENSGEFRAHGELENVEYYLLVGLHLNYSLRWRTEGNSEHMENRRTCTDYYLVGLHLKFVMENSGEFRAHGELENAWNTISSWVTFSLHWRTVENSEHMENWRTVECQRCISSYRSCWEQKKHGELDTYS